MNITALSGQSNTASYHQDTTSEFAASGQAFSHDIVEASNILSTMSAYKTTEMDIPAYSAQINTTSGSFRNCSERGISPQAFSRNVQDAADLLCTVRFCKTNEDNHLQPTVPFNNPFDDSRFEKRSIVIVNGHTQKDPPLDATVRKKLQNKPPPSYIPANERFSIHSILGSGLSTLQSSSLQSSSLVENNLHQPEEKSNSAAPEVFPEPRLTTATSLNATPLVSGKKDRARSKAKYNASDKGKMTSAKYAATEKGKEARAKKAREARAKYAATEKGKEARARARAKYTATEQGKEARAKYVASKKGKEARARARAKYTASEKYKETMAKYAASEKGKEARARARAKYVASEKGKEAMAKYAASEKGKEARAKYAASEKGKEARARAKYKASEEGKMVRAISKARTNAFRSARRQGFSKEIAREKGELAAQARKLSYQERLRHLSAIATPSPENNRPVTFPTELQLNSLTRSGRNFNKSEKSKAVIL